MLQRIGKYEILGQIGRGGQGTVYRARDTGLDRIVAIKVIDQSVAEDPGYLDALCLQPRNDLGIVLEHWWLGAVGVPWADIWKLSAVSEEDEVLGSALASLDVFLPE